MRTTILALLACVPFAAVQDDETAPPRLHLVSVYTEPPFDIPPQIGVRGVLVTGRVAHGERVWLSLDPNTCQLGLFGDSDRCTEIGGWMRQVELREAGLPDPQRRGRKLYLLDDEDLEGRVFLVGPDRSGHGMRLVLRDAQGEVARVLSLERQPMPAHLREDR